MTTTPRTAARPRTHERDGHARLAEVERALSRVLARLATGLSRPSPLALELLLERTLRDAERLSRGAADSRDGASPRWTALFNRLLAGSGDRLGAALVAHRQVRVSDENAAASVVVHAIEGLVRRSAELPSARARAAARAEVTRMLKVFLGAQ